jgi:hypothetical protein
MTVRWNDPFAWSDPSDLTPRRELEALGCLWSLRAVDAVDALAMIQSLDLTSDWLPQPAYGRFPTRPEEVDAFLAAAGPVVEPDRAASRLCGRLAAREHELTPAALAGIILEIWRGAQRRLDPRDEHSEGCGCLMNCPRMPAPIRALDEAVQRYYEDHHDQPAPQCFGELDESFNRAIAPLVRTAVAV